MTNIIWWLRDILMREVADHMSEETEIEEVNDNEPPAKAIPKIYIVKKEEWNIYTINMAGFKWKYASLLSVAQKLNIDPKLLAKIEDKGQDRMLIITKMPNGEIKIR